METEAAQTITLMETINNSITCKMFWEIYKSTFDKLMFKPDMPIIQQFFER